MAELKLLAESSKCGARVYSGGSISDLFEQALRDDGLLSPENITLAQGTTDLPLYDILSNMKGGETMSYFEMLMKLLSYIPPATQEKIFDLYRDYKSMMVKLDRQMKLYLPDEFEAAAIAEAHKALANVFVHGVLKLCKEAHWYTKQTFDLVLALTQKLFGVPNWEPSWWDDSYAQVE